MPFFWISDLIFFENFFHIKSSKNSGAEPIPRKPKICLWKYLNWFNDNHEPILDPTKIKFFFLIIFFIEYFTSWLHFEILPLVKSPEDFPWPEYSNPKNPKFLFLQYLMKFFGFSPSRSDINPWRNTR